MCYRLGLGGVRRGIARGVRRVYSVGQVGDSRCRYGAAACRALRRMGWKKHSEDNDTHNEQREQHYAFHHDLHYSGAEKGRHALEQRDVLPASVQSNGHAFQRGAHDSEASQNEQGGQP